MASAVWLQEHGHQSYVAPNLSQCKRNWTYDKAKDKTDALNRIVRARPNQGRFSPTLSTKDDDIF
jgi:hypothetical protein